MTTKRAARMTKTTARGHRKAEEGKITLYDLVEEITGVNREEDGFDSERKKVTRMLNDLGKGNNQEVIDGFNSASDQDKTHFMNFLKSLYYDEIKGGKVGRLILNKLSKKKAVDQKYSTEFYKKGLDYVRHTVKDEDKERFDILSKNFLSENYYEEVSKVAERLFNAIEEDLRPLENLLREDMKLELIADYEKIINQSLEEWRNEVIGIRAYEMAISKEERRRIVMDETPGYRERVRAILEEYEEYEKNLK